MFYIHGKLCKPIRYYRVNSFIMFRCCPYQILGHTTTSDGSHLVHICHVDNLESIYLPFDTKVYNAELHSESIFDDDDDDLPF